MARYFAAEQTVIEQREAERDAISRQMEEMDEEHGGEEGLLNDAKNDKGKLTKASVKARLAEVKLYNGPQEQPTGYRFAVLGAALRGKRSKGVFLRTVGQTRGTT